jgi:chorismate mutase/prephenate dehydratase
MDISKSLQQREFLQNTPLPDYPNFVTDNPKSTIACQGTSGANSETAAKSLFSSEKITFFKDFDDVFQAVKNGIADYGILPVNNTISGSIGYTYDLLNEYDCYVTATPEIPIDHCICAKNFGYKVVYSHPQAILQCSNYLKQNGLQCVEWSNTASAAYHVSTTDEPAAAICSVECAEKYGLNIYEKNIANYKKNSTKFVCISKECQVAIDADTVSIVIVIPHIPGSLHRLMTKFFVSGVNITKLESRPLADGSFNVKFYIDFDGNIHQKKTVALLKEIEKNVEYFKFLGNFKAPKD